MADSNAITDDSLAFLYRAAASRGPGKRQVRVVSRERLVANFGDLGVDDEEDDEDFRVEDATDDESDNSDDGSSQDDGGNDNQKGSDEEDSDEDDAESKEDEESDTGINAAASSQNLYSGLSTVNNTPDESNLDVPGCMAPSSDSVCCICLNLKSGNDEIVQCDLCGLTVHEGCYGVVETNTEDGSETSSESTEPWFCEPCLAGLNPRSPNGDVYCELCPNKGGAYKRTDTGRWVHLLCAFYNSNVTFGDPERLSAVCLSNVPANHYGFRSCALCTNKLLSRTGVCVKCDAGMCKMYLHITCGQKFGLLVDSLLNAGDRDSPEQNSIADPYYLCCLAHSERSAVKLKKHQYTKMDLQISKFAPKTLTERENECLQQKRHRFNDYFARKFVSGPSNVDLNVTVEKQQRLMTSSYEFMSKMRRKSELCLSITEEQWENEFRIGFTPDMVGKYVMPVAFAADFVSYYHEREKFIPSVGAQLKKLTLTNTKLKSAQENVKEKFDLTDRNYKSLTDGIENKYERLKNWCNVLKKFNCKNVRSPDAPTFKIKRAQVDSSQTSPSKLNFPQHKMVVESKENSKNKLKSSATMAPMKKIPGKFPANLPTATSPIKNLECATCHKSNDTHRLAYCDTCKLHYHLTCLDPPLTKMPRKTAAYGWECSSCSRRTSSESDEEKEPDVNAPRQLRTSHKPVQRYIAEHTSSDVSSPAGLNRKKNVEKAKISKFPRSADAKDDEEESPSSSPDKSNVADDIVAGVMKKVFSADNSPSSTKSSSSPSIKNGVINSKNLSSSAAKRRNPLNTYALGALKKARLLKPGVGTALHPPPSSLYSPSLDEESSDEEDEVGDDDVDQGCYDDESPSNAPKKRMQYQKLSLTKAIDAVFTGEMGAKRASQVFGVPRSTIGRRIRQMKKSKQSSSPANDRDDDSSAVHVIRVEDLE